MKMHNAPHSWPDLLELLQSWWRGDTPLGAVVMSIIMAGLRIAYFGGGELFTDYSDHPRKLVTLNPKLKSTAAGRYQLLSRWWDAYRKQLGLKDFSPESQDAVALQQIKERGALPMIDRGDIRQAIDRCSNIWASLPGAGYGQFEHKADSLIAKFKEAGGTVREIEV